jgi:hypothetical protein
MIQVACNPEHHRHMMHHDLRFFWLCDMVNLGGIATCYIATAGMATDLLTKVLACLKVAATLAQLGLTAPKLVLLPRSGGSRGTSKQADDASPRETGGGAAVVGLHFYCRRC